MASDFRAHVTPCVYDVTSYKTRELGVLMAEIVFEPDELYKAYNTSKGVAVDDGWCRVRTMSFTSRWSGFLWPTDGDIEENRIFNYLMMEPVEPSGEARSDILVITHGLNEGSYAKLFPWAYNLVLQLHMPVLIFPMAFHITRRSGDWGFSPQGRLANTRSVIKDNYKTSPFNAQISARLSRAPERFYLGGLQSYYDVIDLTDQIRAGAHPGCRPDTRVHFLGYSAGGYLAMNLLLSNPEGRFSESRVTLLASCASLDGMQPKSIFIMDVEAGNRLMTFLHSRHYMDIIPEGMAEKLIEIPRHWMTEIFFHGPSLTSRLETMKDQLLVMANPIDRVIRADAIASNLHPIPVLHLDLGVHEFPFNMPGPLIVAYDRRQDETRTMLSRIRKGHRIAPAYRSEFVKFIHSISTFMDAKQIH